MRPAVAATCSLAACLAAGVGPGLAQTVIRCVDAQGKVSYQAQACASGRQTEVHLKVAPPDASAASRPSMWKGYTPPKFAAMVFYYDPKDEPVGFSTAQMESMLQAAMRAWMAGCQVELKYGGKAPKRPGTPEHVSVHWVPEFMFMAHPGDGRSVIAGAASLSYGIGLRPRFTESNMLSVLVHEMGHVLGLPHAHEDSQSIMSYLRDESTRTRARPSAGDFLACNLSMKKMFGIDFAAPADAPAPRDRPAMTDREALERIRAKQER